MPTLARARDWTPVTFLMPAGNLHTNELTVVGSHVRIRSIDVGMRP